MSNNNLDSSMTAEEEIKFSRMAYLRIHHGPCKFKLMKMMNESLKLQLKIG